MKKRKLILAAFISVIVTILYLILWGWLASRGVFHPIDFWVYYAEATLIWDGHGNQLYNVGLQSQYQLQLLGVLPLNGHVLPFVGPPHLAIALLPLATLPPYFAFSFWIALQIMLVVLLVWLYVEDSPSLSWPERIITIGAFCSFPMLFVTIYKGQLSLIILFCIFCWFKQMCKGSDKGIAFWLLLGSIKPQLIVVPFFLTLLARRWKALAYFVAGATLLTALCTVLLGLESIGDFVLSMLSIDSNFSPTPYPAYMYNFKGFLTLVLGLGAVPLIRALTFAGFLFALVIVIYLWRGRVDIDDKNFRIKTALSLLLGIFFCPYLFYYDTLLLVVVAKLFHDFLMNSFKESVKWIFLLIMYTIPIFFLESSMISVAGLNIRWPVILMISWMLSISYIIHYHSEVIYSSSQR